MMLRCWNRNAACATCSAAAVCSDRNTFDTQKAATVAVAAGTDSDR